MFSVKLTLKQSYSIMSQRKAKEWRRRSTEHSLAACWQIVLSMQRRTNRQWETDISAAWGCWVCGRADCRQTADRLLVFVYNAETSGAAIAATCDGLCRHSTSSAIAAAVAYLTAIHVNTIADGTDASGRRHVHCSSVQPATNFKHMSAVLLMLNVKR